LLFPQENRTFGISGIMSFRSRIEHFDVQKTLQGVNYPYKKIWANFFWLIWGHVAPLYDVKRRENYAIVRPGPLYARFTVFVLPVNAVG
jgi:hypothetical protein